MARAGLGWTLADLAKKSGVNPNTLSRYESGREMLSGKLRKVEAALRAAGVVFTEEDDVVAVSLPLIEKQNEIPGGRRLASSRTKS